MVESIGGIKADLNLEASKEEIETAIKDVGDEFLTPDRKIIKSWKNLIDDCEKKNISLGGSGVVIFYGLPVGLGSYVEYDRRLDGKLASVIMSIPAIKGVEIGNASEISKILGNSADEIKYGEKGFYRSGNYSGGLEGGVTNGQPLIIRFFMKPLPSNSLVNSVDLITKKVSKPGFYRSDIQAVSAAAVIVESVVALELASQLC